MSLLLGCFLFFANFSVDGAKPEPVIAADASAQTYLATCRKMLPREIEIKGRIIVRNQRGIPQCEHAYRLVRTVKETRLWLNDQNVAQPAVADFSKPIAGTDVTWSDLTFDYLWWPTVEFDQNRESETVHGQACTVLLISKDSRCVRVWIDRQYGALLQAEELANSRVIRRLWGTRIKKFGERWAPNVLEVEVPNTKRRTKITVEDLRIPGETNLKK